MKKNQNTKFIGMDVHKLSISLAIAAEGAEGEVIQSICMQPA
jgi:hypothetical protein